MKVARYRRYHAEQKHALYALVDPISPPPKPVPQRIGPQFGTGLGWRRRVLPPGPMGLLRRPFIAIAGLLRHNEYKRRRLTKKERRVGSVNQAVLLQDRPRGPGFWVPEKRT